MWLAIFLTAWNLLSCYGALPSAPLENELPKDFNVTKAVIEFKYGSDGPAHWTAFARDCGGLLQSPINVDTTSTQRVYHPHLFWWNYHRRPEKMTLTNNGHTVVLSGIWNQVGLTPYHWHSNGDSVESFVIDHIHFHWGFSEDGGSEHKVNDIGFPMEMHAVHYSKSYKSLDEALSESKGVRVISLLFMLSEIRNSAMDEIVRWLPQLRRPNSITIEPFEIGKLLVRFAQAFITYNGSLTTPPCTEAVNWIIRLTPSTISADQLAEFRKLEGHEGDPLSGNVRPLQPVNGRSIKHVY